MLKTPAACHSRTPQHPDKGRSSSRPKWLQTAVRQLPKIKHCAMISALNFACCCLCCCLHLLEQCREFCQKSSNNYCICFCFRIF